MKYMFFLNKPENVIKKMRVYGKKGIGIVIEDLLVRYLFYDTQKLQSS